MGTQGAVDAAGRVVFGGGCAERLDGLGPDLAVGWAYSSGSTANGPYGYGGHLATAAALRAEAAALPSWVELTRPSGATVSYSYESGSYRPLTAGLLGVLVTATSASGTVWQESLPDGMTAVYPAVSDGGLCSVSYLQDPVGRSLTYSYDGSGRLAGVVEPAGRQVTFAYTGGGLVQSVQDWGDRRTTFAYDTASVPGQPLLTTITGPSGCQTALGYDSSFTGQPLLNSITDAEGYQTTYTYFADGRCREETLVGVATTRYTYTALPLAMVVANAVGEITTTSFYSSGQPFETIGPSGIITTWIRNDAGLEVASIAPNGAITTTTRSSFVTPSPGYPTYWPYLPLAVTDPLGHSVSHSYDEYGNQLTTTRPDGTVSTIVYGYSGSSFDETGAKRQPQVLIGPAADRTTLSYDGRGLLTSVAAPNGGRTTYGYDAWGRASSVTDALGQVTTRTYDVLGRPTVVENPMGARWTTTYDALGRPLTQTDPAGAVTTQLYDSRGQLVVRIDPAGARTSYSYNAYGAAVQVVDALGHRSTQQYDAVGRLLASIDPLGRIQTTVYDLAGRLAASVDPSGARTTFEYDAYGRGVAVQAANGAVTTRVYDVASRPLASVQPDGATTTAVFDSFGRPLGSLDPLGYQATIVYDAAGRPCGSINPLGLRQTVIYDAAGRQTAAVDPLGHRSTVVYDALNRPVARIGPGGGRTSYSYDAAGRQVALCDANSHLWTSLYDARGQLVGEVDALGARTTYSYDLRGARIGQVDARQWPTTFTYDLLGRLGSTTYRDGSQVLPVYDALGRVVVLTDASGVTTTVYDAAGRVESVAAGPGWVLSYTYDSVGNRLTLADPDGGQTSYGYDLNNRLTHLLDPTGERTTWVWDLAGRLQRQELANGVVASQTYDAAGRAVSRGYWAPDGAVLALYTASYDAAGNRLTVAELDGEYRYGYDAGGQLVSELLLGDDPVAPVYRYSYTYDAVGNRLLLDQGSQRVESQYNAADELLGEVTYGPAAAVELGLTPLVAGPYSAPALALQAPLLPGRRYTLDGAAVEAVGATGTWSGSGWGLALQSRDAALAPLASLATTTFAAAGAGQAVFDSAAVLDSDQAAAVTVGVARQGTPPNLLRLSGSVGALVEEKLAVTTYTYDAVGNTLVAAGASVVTHTWDAANRLVAREVDGARTTHTYAASGLRTRRESGAGTTQFVWDGANLLAERDGAGATVARYVDFPGSWGGLTNRRAAGTSQWFAFDLSSNARLLLDATGAVSGTARYTAFGPPLTSTLGQPYGFGGQVGYYTESGEEVYVRARWLRLASGRWESRDPIGLRQPTLYGYVGSHPVASLDPSGLSPWTWIPWKWIWRYAKPGIPISVAIGGIALVCDVLCKYHLGVLEGEQHRIQQGVWPLDDYTRAGRQSFQQCITTCLGSKYSRAQRKCQKKHLYKDEDHAEIANYDYGYTLGDSLSPKGDATQCKAGCLDALETGKLICVRQQPDGSMKEEPCNAQDLPKTRPGGPIGTIDSPPDDSVWELER